MGVPRMSLVIACGALLVAACQQSGTGEHASTAGSAGGGAAANPPCADTPRDSQDEYWNSQTRDVASHAAPDRSLAVFLALVDTSDSADQADVVARITAIGGTGEPLTEHGVYAMGVRAKHLLEMLCWPKVANVEVDTPYWQAVDPPWGPDEAGDAECPIVDGRCPEHCYQVIGTPFDAQSGCFDGSAELVGCRQDGAETCSDALCVEQTSTGRSFFTNAAIQNWSGYINLRPCTDPALHAGFCSP